MGARHIGVFLAYYFHHQHEVKRTNQFGVIEVDGFSDQMRFLLIKAGIFILLLAIILPGIGLMVWSMLERA